MTRFAFDNLGPDFSDFMTNLGFKQIRTSDNWIWTFEQLSLGAIFILTYFLFKIRVIEFGHQKLGLGLVIYVILVKFPKLLIKNSDVQIIGFRYQTLVFRFRSRCLNVQFGYSSI